MNTELEEYPAADLAPTEPVDPVALVGFVAEFADVDSVLTAATKVRAAGYKVWDVHSPFPIHGIDEVIGIRPTILPWLVLCGGLTGTSCAVLMEWWMNAYDYPFLISGKPIFSFPANIPIVFELTVLFSALTAVFGMLGLNRLPLHYNPLFKSRRFRRVTSDRFFVVIDASDRLFDETKTPNFLESLGAISVERVED